MKIVPRSQFRPMVAGDCDGYAAGAQVARGHDGRCPDARKASPVGLQVPKAPVRHTGGSLSKRKSRRQAMLLERIMRCQNIETLDHCEARRSLRISEAALSTVGPGTFQIAGTNFSAG